MAEVLRLTHESENYQVTLRSDDVSYAWQKFKGRIGSANIGQDAGAVGDAEHYCRYASGDKCTLWLHRHAGLQADNTTSVQTEWEAMWPVVFETCDYNIAIRFRPGYLDKGTEPRVRHVRRDVETSFFTDRAYNGKNAAGEVVGMSGNVSFLNEPGIFKLEFEYQHGGRRMVSWFTFPVVSPKLDTKKDYKRLLHDVNEEYNDIIFRYLATTYQQLARGRVRNDVVWMNIFENIVEDYLKNVEMIIRQPHQKVRGTVEYARAERIKRWTPSMEEEYAERRKAKEHDRHYFRYTESETTYNTRENRFVKHTLLSIGGRLTHILDEVLKRGRNDELSDHHRRDLENYRQRFERLSRHPFFRTIGRYEGNTGDSLVLQSRAGYSQVYKDWIKLRRGIDLYNGASNIGTLQIWEIYELWCFIKMKRMVRQLLHITGDNPYYESLVSEPKGTLLNPFTNSTMEHVVRFEYPVPTDSDQSEWAQRIRAHKGDVITLHYQHTFNRRNNDDFGVHTATTEQRPDIVLNIEKKDGAAIILTYLYDAKYRVINDSRLDKDLTPEDEEEMRQHGGDYPPADAINQMHRYRDAIYYGENRGEQSGKEVIGGYILFPGRGDDMTIKHRYFSDSVKSVNIGAFPLLPKNVRHEDKLPHEEDDSQQLYDHLREILLVKAVTTEHVGSSIPQRGLQYTDDPELALAKKWRREKVLIAINEQTDRWNTMTHYAIGLDMCPKAFDVVKEFSTAKYLLITNYKNTRLYKIKGQLTIETTVDKTTCLARAFHTPAAGVLPAEELERRKAKAIVDVYLQIAIDTALGVLTSPDIDLQKVKQTVGGEVQRYDPRVVRMENVIAKAPAP